MTEAICSVENCDRPGRKRGWCHAHYKRWLDTGDLQVETPVRDLKRNFGACKVLSCDRDAQTLGWCHAHYVRWRRTGKAPDTPIDQRTRVPNKGHICSVDGCENPAWGKGMCAGHFNRFRHHGDVRAHEPLKPQTGRTVGRDGYVMVRAMGHPNAYASGYILEHRLVMSRFLDRPLLPGENIHHVNGDKSDNRLANLELWIESQPPGARVQDKVAWAREILALYGDKFPA